MKLHALLFADTPKGSSVDFDPIAQIKFTSFDRDSIVNKFNEDMAFISSAYPVKLYSNNAAGVNDAAIINYKDFDREYWIACFESSY